MPTGLAFRTYVESSPEAGVETGIAIVNPNSVPVTVQLDLTTADGGQTDQFGSLLIPANGQVSKFLRELFPGLPAGFKGVFRSPTNTGIVIPRLFLNDTPEDRQAILPLVNQIMLYPLSRSTPCDVWRSCHGTGMAPERRRRELQVLSRQQQTFIGSRLEGCPHWSAPGASSYRLRFWRKPCRGRPFARPSPRSASSHP